MSNVRAPIKNGMSPIHPGVILEKEFLLPLKVSAGKLAAHIGVTSARVYEIVSGKRGITASTAIRLAIALGTTPEFWLNLQTTYDLRVEEISSKKEISKHIKLLPELEQVVDL